MECTRDSTPQPLLAVNLSLDTEGGAPCDHLGLEGEGEDSPELTESYVSQPAELRRLQVQTTERYGYALGKNGSSVLLEP